MKPRSLTRWLSHLMGAAALLITGAAAAADVNVMISAGFYQAYSELAPVFERSSGHRLVTTRGPSLGDSPEAIPNRLKRGESADVVIGIGTSIDDLSRQGLLRAGSKVDLARSEIGMVVRAGAREAEHQQRRRVSAHTYRGEVHRLLRQLQRHLSINHAVCEAWHCGSGGQQEPQGEGATVRRAGCRSGGTRRGGDRLSASQ